MKTTTQLFIAAALAGALGAAGTARACDGPSNAAPLADKQGCQGKDKAGCPGKSKDKASCKAKDKSDKTGDKTGDKAACSGKHGCGSRTN